MSRPALPITAAALALALLAGCIVAPYRQPGGYGGGPSGPYGQGYGNPGYGAPSDAPMAVADVEPPPPYLEVIPLLPFAGAIWLGGYWGWNGGRHVWVGGHYDHPREGYAWSPHRWVPVQGRWHLMAGGWVRR